MLDARACASREDTLGKGIVFGKDTPNFVGNRIGAHAMMATIHQMLEDGLTPEDVDAITGSPMAHPKSASFRTADLVGLDTFAHVADNCYDVADRRRGPRGLQGARRTSARWSRRSILGDKTKGGFYKRGADKQIQTLDPKTLEYRPKGGDESIKAATKGDLEDRGPARAREEARRRPGQGRRLRVEGALPQPRLLGAPHRRDHRRRRRPIDDAMKWGYNWELGPFEIVGRARLRRDRRRA